MRHPQTGAGIGRSREIRLVKGLYPEGKGEPLKGNDVLRYGCLRNPHGCMWRVDDRGTRVESETGR